MCAAVRETEEQVKGAIDSFIFHLLVDRSVHIREASSGARAHSMIIVLQIAPYQSPNATSRLRAEYRCG